MNSLFFLGVVLGSFKIELTMERRKFLGEDGEDDASQGADTSSPFHRTSSSKSISREYLNEVSPLSFFFF